jgi:hypothetical protein
MVEPTADGLFSPTTIDIARLLPSRRSPLHSPVTPAFRP